jgi:glycosyltransferase involved in cell wall biosynthesis
LSFSSPYTADLHHREGGLRTKGILKTGVGEWPLVSVVTVLYNGGKYLAQTIDSVLNQRYPALEYIIVDGGSTDNSLDIIRANEHRIDYWVSEPDKGISDAFNKGIGLARGEWVGLINADDWYEDGAVERAMQLAGTADVVYGNLQCWEDGQKDYLFTGNHQMLPLEMTLNHPTVFARRRLYEAWGGYRQDYKIAMDYELLLRFYTQGARFAYVNHCLAHMRLEGVSDRKWIEGFREVNRAKDQHLGKRLAHGLYFYKQVGFTFVSRQLKDAGKRVKLFATLLRLYRKHLAPVKKEQ